MTIIKTFYFPPGTYSHSNSITIKPGYTWHGVTVVPSAPVQLPLPVITSDPVPGTFVEIDFGDMCEKKKESPAVGCTCIKCGEFYPYAEPIEPEKFRCYGCRIVM